MAAQALPPFKIVVLDDDPTGIQTIHGCTLLTRWDPELIEEAFRDSEPFFYILTNSRAYEPQRVREIVAEAVRNVLRVNRTFNHIILFVSRSDSTLRSHFPLEVDTIRDTLFEETGQTVDAVFLCPAFFEGGRRISSFLARLVRELPFEPSFVVAKGGITAHTVMVEGLGITKARVLGQILPGIPVISAAAPTARNDSSQIPFVIFPGNVGEEKALLHVFTVLDFPVPGPR